MPYDNIDQSNFYSLLAPNTCVDCFHPEHHGPCPANDEYWLDPVVGGDPTNEPRPCGCREYINEEMRGRIEVVMESQKARAPFNPQQIDNLRARQKAPLHEYTCLSHSNAALVPGIDGMACPLPGCGYVQRWVHKQDAESRWWEGIDNQTGT